MARLGHMIPPIGTLNEREDVAQGFRDCGFLGPGGCEPAELQPQSAQPRPTAGAVRKAALGQADIRAVDDCSARHERTYAISIRVPLSPFSSRLR